MGNMRITTFIAIIVRRPFPRQRSIIIATFVRLCFVRAVKPSIRRLRSRRYKIGAIGRMWWPRSKASRGSRKFSGNVLWLCFV